MIYTHKDWDYCEQVLVWCKVQGCGWSQYVGWHDYDNGPEGAYAEHWNATHAGKRS